MQSSCVLENEGMTTAASDLAEWSEPHIATAGNHKSKQHKGSGGVKATLQQDGRASNGRR